MPRSAPGPGHLPVEQHLAGRGQVEPRDDQQRALAAAGRPEDGDEVVLGDQGRGGGGGGTRGKGGEVVGGGGVYAVLGLLDPFAVLRRRPAMRERFAVRWT